MNGVSSKIIKSKVHALQRVPVVKELRTSRMRIVDDSGAVTYWVSGAKGFSGVVPQEQKYYGLIVFRQLSQHVIQYWLPKAPVCSDLFISSAGPRGVYEKNPLPHQSVEILSKNWEWYCLIADELGPPAMHHPRKPFLWLG